MEKHKTIKNLPALWETWVWFRSLSWEGRRRRRAWQPPPVFLLGESSWTEEPGRLQSMGSQTVRHNRVTKHSTWKNRCVIAGKISFVLYSPYWCSGLHEAKNQLLSGFLISPELLRTIFPFSDVTHNIPSNSIHRHTEMFNTEGLNNSLCFLSLCLFLSGVVLTVTQAFIM